MRKISMSLCRSIRVTLVGPLFYLYSGNVAVRLSVSRHRQPVHVCSPACSCLALAARAVNVISETVYQLPRRPI